MKILKKYLVKNNEIQAGRTKLFLQNMAYLS